MIFTPFFVLVSLLKLKIASVESNLKTLYGDIDLFLKNASISPYLCIAKSIHQITEFRGPSLEEDEILFLEEVLPWLDSQDYVHRYAYFMASEGSLISGRVLSRLGEKFASFV